LLGSGNPGVDQMSKYAALIKAAKERGAVGGRALNYHNE
jgi:hypothetical protein